MKILYVTHSFPPHHWRGTEIYTFELAREMKKTHDVSVLYLVDQEAASGPELRSADYHGIPLVQMLKKLDPSQPEDYFFNEKIETLFKQALEDQKPDVVHFTYFLGGFSANLLSIAESTSKVIVTVTDFAAFCPRGQLLDRDYQPCGGPRGALRCTRCLFDVNLAFQNQRLDTLVRELFPASLAGLFKKPGLQLLRKRLKALRSGLRGAAHVVFSNPNTRYIFVDQGFRFNITHVIDYGIDTAPYSNHAKTPGKVMRLGYIGQVLPHKGLDTLIEAVRGVESSGFSLYIYGSLADPGSREYYDSLDMPSNADIEHKGVFEFEEMNRILEDIDVLVVPSIWQENCPLIVKYGLATRTRMILSDVPGMVSGNLPDHGVYEFPAGDPEALKSIITRLIETEEWKKPLEPHDVPVTDMPAHAGEIERLYRN